VPEPWRAIVSKKFDPRCLDSSKAHRGTLQACEQWLVGRRRQDARRALAGSVFAGTSQMASKTMPPVARRGAPRLCPSALPARQSPARRSSDIANGTGSGRAQRSFCARAKELETRAQQRRRPSEHGKRPNSKPRQPASTIPRSHSDPTDLRRACRDQRFALPTSPTPAPNPPILWQSTATYGNTTRPRFRRSCAQMPKRLSHRLRSAIGSGARGLALPPQTAKAVATMTQPLCS